MITTIITPVSMECKEQITASLQGINLTYQEDPEKTRDIIVLHISPPPDVSTTDIVELFSKLFLHFKIKIYSFVIFADGRNDIEWATIGRNFLLPGEELKIEEEKPKKYGHLTLIQGGKK